MCANCKQKGVLMDKFFRNWLFLLLYLYNIQVITQNSKCSLVFTDFHRKSISTKHFVSLEKIEEIFRDTGWCHLRSPTPHDAGTSPWLCHLFSPSISSFILLGTPSVSFLCSPEPLYCGEKSVFLKPASHIQTHVDIWKNKSPSVYR